MRNGLGTRGSLLVVCLAASAALSGAGSALAAIRTWTGGGGDANWSTAANWGGTAPVAGDDLVFPGGALQLTNTNDIAAGTSFNTISFTGASGGYHLAGNSIQLVAGISATNTAGDNTVALPLQLTASQTFTSTIGSSNRLFVTNTVNLGANTLSLNAGGGAIIQVDGAISGTGGVTLTGPGLVVLFGANTNSGPTIVQAGQLLASNLTGAGPVTVQTGGLIQFANDFAVGVLTVNTGATAEFAGGGANQTGRSANFTAQSGALLNLAMYTATNYGQMVVSGPVTLNSPTLTLSWLFTSSTGQAFTIINKTSAGAITGTFNGMPEGFTFTANSRLYRITYVGGDGNDAVVTDITGQQNTEAIPTAGGVGLTIFAVLLAVGGLFLLRRTFA